MPRSMALSDMTMADLGTERKSILSVPHLLRNTLVIVIYNLNEWYEFHVKCHIDWPKIISHHKRHHILAPIQHDKLSYYHSSMSVSQTHRPIQKYTRDREKETMGEVESEHFQAPTMTVDSHAFKCCGSGHNLNRHFLGTNV